MSRPIPKAHYDALLPVLRKYCSDFTVADGFDMRKGYTSHQKGLMTKYANVLRELSHRNNYIFRGKDPVRMKAAKVFGQHPEHTPRIKVAFIPFTPSKNQPNEKPKLIFKRDVLRIETSRHIKTFAAFDQVNLAVNTEKEVRAAIKSLGHADSYTIANGTYQIAVPLDAGIVVMNVKKLMMRYDGQSALPRGYKGSGDSPADHDYRKWLNGVIGYQFKQQHGGVKHFMESLAAAKKARKKKTLPKGGFGK